MWKAIKTRKEFVLEICVLSGKGFFEFVTDNMCPFRITFIWEKFWMSLFGGMAGFGNYFYRIFFGDCSGTIKKFRNTLRFGYLFKRYNSLYHCYSNFDILYPKYSRRINKLEKIYYILNFFIDQIILEKENIFYLKYFQKK